MTEPSAPPPSLSPVCEDQVKGLADELVATAIRLSRLTLNYAGQKDEVNREFEMWKLGAQAAIQSTVEALQAILAGDYKPESAKEKILDLVPRNRNAS